MKGIVKLNLLLVLLLVSICLAGCAQSEDEQQPTEVTTETPTSTPKTTPTQAPANLEGTLWKLDSYLNNRSESVDVLPNTEITLEFKEDKIGGSAGCNSYFGPYEVEDSNLTIGEIGRTVMACAPPVDEQETQYLAALKSAASYEVTNGKLQIANEDGKTALTFSVLEPLPLTGTTWRLNGYNNGKGGFVSVLSSTEITVNFGDDGNLAGSAGCNNYKASYEVDGDTISIGPVAVTRKMCAEPEGIMEQEEAYLAALESAVTYQIKGDSLEFRDSSGKRMLSYTAAKVETVLRDMKWVLVSFGQVGSEKAVLPGTEVSIQFTKDNKINGSGSCNRYFASYETGADNTLSIGMIGSTEMACPDEIMEQEQQYFNALGSVTAFVVDQDRLQLLYGDGQKALNFQK